MGEFNVNKSDGSLEQTAGMPSEYPATQVMLSDGVTSVEDAIASAEIKMLYGNVTSDTVAANSSGSVVIPIPSGAQKIIGLTFGIPVPNTNWNTYALVTSPPDPSQSSLSLGFRTIGGTAQKYTLYYNIWYQ